MKTYIICGCCGNQTIIHNYLYSFEEFAVRKVFVKGKSSLSFHKRTLPVPYAITCEECGESCDMNVFGKAHIIPFHMKYLYRPSILSNNRVYANGHNISETMMNK